MSLTIESVDDPGGEWDQFAVSRSDSTLGHAAAWASVLRESYGLEPQYLCARDAAGSLAGVLPLVRFRGLLGGVSLISLPFLDAAGILASGPEAERALVDAACLRARESGAAAVELRQLTPSEGLTPVPGERVLLVLRLETDEDAQWKALRAKTRNQTRKATREGLVIGEPVSDEAALDAFYSPFCENMRDLGSPVHGRGFFAEAQRGFGPGLRFVGVERRGRPIGGLVAIHWGRRVYVPWASTLQSERSRCPNNLIYWEALRWAIGQGASELDFGRSPPDPQGGTYRFKKGWGAEPRDLHWHRLGVEDGLPLQGSGRASASPVLRRMTALWRQLPVGLSAALGPRIRGRLSE